MAKNFSRVYAAQPFQLEGHVVSVEIDITHGFHNFSIVGLPDKAVEEARDRVSSAIKNSGYLSPKQENQKTVVSLAPAELRKNGSYFDLAIALGYLLANHEITFEPEKKIFIAELSLNGEVRPVTGILTMVLAAKKAGFEECYISESNAEEAALVEGITIYPLHHLTEIINHLNTSHESSLCIQPQPPTLLLQETPSSLSDFQYIKGNELVKRGLEIAAAGGHNMIMSGPPGTGKTMLARAFSELLPPLTYDEILEVTSIHSIAGLLKKECSLITRPPFRSPHHTSSHVSIIGGGSSPKPGEITLAHRGVLFLDEFPEFDKQVIESLRQPLEDRVVYIARARGTAQFPAQCILLAAMNPCPCGNKGSLYKTCVCNEYDIARYHKKISGPILDRIDIWSIVEHLPYETLADHHYQTESSHMVRERILATRAIQKKRFGTSLKLNAHMSVRDISDITLAPEVLTLLHESSVFYKLSPRAYHRIIKIARTIADLAHSETIEAEHILEAFQYRPKQSV